MKKTLQALFAITCILPTIVVAQGSSNTLDFLNSQQSEQLKNNTLALSDPALVKAQAQLHRKHYEALIDVGFSKDEALKIVVAMAQRDNQ
ncbi:MAG: hypothetical protein ACI88A_001747 [Paraglaciecola sp.]|jgi:hypothetical protein